MLIPVVVSSSSPLPCTTHAVSEPCTRQRGQHQLDALDPSATPISWRRTRPGLAIGPSRLNTVGIPISRRDRGGEPERGVVAGARGRSRTRRCSMQRRNALRRQLDRDAERLEHVGGAALGRSRPGAVLAHGHAGAGTHQRRHRADVHRVAAVAARADDVERTRAEIVGQRHRSSPRRARRRAARRAPRRSRPSRARRRRRRSAARGSRRRRGSRPSPHGTGRRRDRRGRAAR